jgi:hypothetical protein
MKNKIAILVLLTFAAGGLFAQEEMAEDSRPMNTITVDVGPTIVGLGLGGIIGAVSGGGSGMGVGIGAQYERHINQNFAAALRVAYLMTGLSISGASVDINSFSVEGHGRFYPFGGAFFLDAMAGYANFNMGISGGPINLSSDGNYVKLGGKLGWKIDFGKPGGFVFEPAIGYSAGIKLSGKNFGKVSTGYSEIDDMAANLVGSVDELKNLIANFVFVGGPRITLAGGWTF